jgi:hypothetical protein
MKKLQMCAKISLEIHQGVTYSTYLKTGAGGEAQAVENLPCKCETLSSNPNTVNKTKQNLETISEYQFVN